MKKGLLEDNDVRYDVGLRDIVIPPRTIDILLHIPKKHRTYAMALYLFYYTKAIWTHTNKIWCNNKYVTGGKEKKGLGWCCDKVLEIKKVLAKAKLIQIIKQEKAGGTFTKSYIRVFCIGNTAVANTAVDGRFGDKMLKNEYNNTGDREKTVAVRRRELVKKISPFDELWGEKFERTINRQGHMTHKVKRRRWVNELQLLRIKDGYRKGVIKKVLKWFFHNINERYTPRIYKAADLRDKFLRMKDAMTRHQGEFGDGRTAKPTITKMAYKIAKEQSQAKSWPKGSESDLPHTIPISLNNHSAFAKHFLKAYKTANLSVGLKHLHQHLKNQGLFDSEFFVKLWMDEIHNNISNWDKWNGNLVSMAFEFKSSRFYRWGRKVTAEFCGEPGKWDNYINILQK